MMQSRRIEILMAAYNGAPYIGEQIDSILQQTDTNWHLTISDDGSTDGTDAIIDEYTRQYSDSVQRVCSGQRFGGAKAHFFWMTQQCEAEYIAYCDDDDTWKADKLEKLRNAMQDAESRLGSNTPILVFSDQTVTDEKLSVIAPSLMRYQKQYFEHFDYRSILMQNVVTGGAMMANRALSQLALQCADTSQVIMHDWWMAAVAARFGEIVYIDEPLGAYRQHGNNSVGAQRAKGLGGLLKKALDTRAIRGSIQATRAQAQAFAKAFDLPESDLIAQYGHLGSLSRLKRLRFCRENGIRRSRAIENLAFWIYG